MEYYSALGKKEGSYIICSNVDEPVRSSASEID